MKKLTPAQILKALEAAGLTPSVPGRERVIEAIRAEPGLSTAQIAERVHMAWSTTQALVRALRDEGLVASGRRKDGREAGYVWVGGDE